MKVQSENWSWKNKKNKETILFYCKLKIPLANEMTNRIENLVLFLFCFRVKMCIRYFVSPHPNCFKFQKTASMIFASYLTLNFIQKCDLIFDKVGIVGWICKQSGGRRHRLTFRLDFMYFWVFICLPNSYWEFETKNKMASPSVELPSAE